MPYVDDLYILSGTRLLRNDEQARRTYAVSRHSRQYERRVFAMQPPFYFCAYSSLFFVT